MTKGPSSGLAKNAAAVDGSGTTSFFTYTGGTVHYVHIYVIPPPAMTKRPYLRAADRRRQLLDAAGRLFDRVGFAGITMSGLAVEAGVSRQLVYDHFSDLDSLYLAFVDDRLARYRADVPDITSLGPGDAAATMFGHLLTIPPADRRIIRLLMADIGVQALEHVRRRFHTEELSRWPAVASDAKNPKLATTLVSSATSALLALADAVTSEDITVEAATDIAVNVVEAVVRSATPPSNEPNHKQRAGTRIGRDRGD